MMKIRQFANPIGSFSAPPHHSIPTPVFPFLS